MMVINILLEYLMIALLVLCGASLAARCKIAPPPSTQKEGAMRTRALQSKLLGGGGGR